MLRSPSLFGPTRPGGEELVERVETFRPVAPVARDPLRGALHRADDGPAASLPSRLLARQEPRALEHAQVLRDRGQRDVEGLGERADARLATGERDEDRASGRVGECGEHRVEPLRTLNHEVNRIGGAPTPVNPGGNWTGVEYMLASCGC